MHEPLASKPRSLVEGTRIMLDELFCALEESIDGLSNEQVWSHPVEGRHAIGLILLHVQANIDWHACFIQSGKPSLEHDMRFDFYGKPVADFVDLPDVPHVDELRQRHITMRDAVMATLEGIDDDTLYTPRFGEQTHWWQQGKRVSIDGYHRVVWHAHTHIRQIWCLRGAMGAAEGPHYPKQFWH